MILPGIKLNFACHKACEILRVPAEEFGAYVTIFSTPYFEVIVSLSYMIVAKC